MSYPINPDWLVSQRLEVARYAFDGDMVYAPFGLPDNRVVLKPALVTCAAGNHVRVKGVKEDFERWFSVWDIYRRMPYPDATPAAES